MTADQPDQDHRDPCKPDPCKPDPCEPDPCKHGHDKHPGCGPHLPKCCPVQYVVRSVFCVDVVVDNNGAPADILEAAKPFDVKGRIIITAGQAITGKARVTIYADQLGGSFDGPLGYVEVDIPGDGTYPWTVTVPADTLPDTPPDDGSALYRLAAVLTMKNSSGVTTETSSFVEIGTFRVS
jgi:hypothetical protein